MKTILLLILASISPIIAETTKKAEQGDPEAIYRMSMIYEHGYDTIAPDTTRAISLLRQAAGLNYPPAANYLGYLYQKGHIIRQDPDSARFWIARAAASGDPKAANNLAFMLLESGTPAADSIALPYLRQAADAGLPTAITTLANMYAQGRALQPDTLTAIALYDRAISLGFHDAELYLLNLMGPVWIKESPLDRLNRALHYWQTGSPLIANELLSFLPHPDAIRDTYLPPRDSGDTIPDSGDSISSRISKSNPVHGNGDKMSNRSSNTEDGESAQESPVAGLTRSQTGRAYALLGHAYSHGAGVPYDHSLANKYFIAAALLGDPAASYILAETLEIFPDLLPEVTPDQLREQAAQKGISDARAAATALTSLPIP